MAKSCFLFGQNDFPNTISTQLEAAIETHYAQGVRNFYVGAYGNFDCIAGFAVKKAKQKHPDIFLFLVIPYTELKIIPPKGYDGAYCPPTKKIPKKFRIARSNRYMARNCDCAICYASPLGKQRHLLRIIRRRKVPDTNLYNQRLRRK